ncbi:MAG TPA: NDP-sugar synthase [archaeon]|nr:NDP-sugar synthase [archaeon]
MPAINSPRDYFLNTQIVVHAGGLSERWFPITQGKFPKPLTEIGKKLRPMIHWTVLPYILAGAKKFYLTLWHQPEAIVDHFKEISKQTGIEFVPLIEPENKRMGRAGVIKHYMDQGVVSSKQPILSINSDDIVKVNPIELAKFQFGGLDKGFFATVMGSSMEVSQYGRIKYNPKTNVVNSFIEKPEFRLTDSELVNTGIFYFDTEVVKHFLDIKESEFPVDIERSKFLQEHAVPVMRALDLVTLGKTWFVLNTPDQFKKLRDLDYEKFFEITNIERYLGPYSSKFNSHYK